MNETHVHAHEPHVNGLEHDAFYARPRAESPYLHCSYCGSLRVIDAIAAAKVSGAQIELADMKYGWPHKVYIVVPHEPVHKQIGSSSFVKDGVRVEEPIMGTVSSATYKFYTTHLREATVDEMAAWNEAVGSKAGVAFRVDPTSGRVQVRYL